MQGDSHNRFVIERQGPWRYLCLNIYPDGGIARFRVYGYGHRDWSARAPDRPVELSGMRNGGRVVACSDQHFASMSNIIKPNEGVNMSDAWETRRRREPGFDWVVVKFGCLGVIQKVEVNTRFHKGNFPEHVSFNAAHVPAAGEPSVDVDTHSWPLLMKKQPLGPDSAFVFDEQLLEHAAISHVRINIHPDGGLSRVRFFGLPAPDGS